MRVKLADYQGWRKMIDVEENTLVVRKKTIKILCNRMIDLWERRKKNKECNQDVAMGQIKAYSFIRDVLATRKRIKKGKIDNRFYWVEHEKKN